MPRPDQFDETAADVLSGISGPATAGDDPLMRFVQEVRAVADRPAPTPTGELARVLQTGFSNPATDPLMTAASTRPKEKHLKMTKNSGFLKGLTGKALVAGTALFVGVSTAAVAGALPGQSHDAAPVAIHSIFPAQVTGAQAGAAAGADTVGTAPPATALPAGPAVVAGGATLAVGAGVTSGPKAGAATNVKPAAHAGASGAADVHAGAGAGRTGAAIVTVPQVLPVVASLKQCVIGAIDSVDAQPTVALANAVPSVLACVQKAIGTLPMPPAISSCVSGLLNSIGGLPFIGSGTGLINLAGCGPIDVSTCLQGVFNAMGNLFGTPAGGAGALPGPGGMTGIVTGCTTSIVDSVMNLVNGILAQMPGAGGFAGATR